jgi:flavin reductase (DIM6/NTAB) family NADH-FMN oxidoreductase RutF
MVNKREFPLAEVYRLLESGPVVLVTTCRAGRANIMPMSWHTMMEFVPPLVGCVISDQNYTFKILRATGECVLNVPTVELARKVVACGNVSGQHMDKFKTFGLTPVPATVVKAPLVAECYANLECRAVDRRLVPKYNFFILEVVKAWIDPRRKRPRTIHHQGEGVFLVPGRTIHLPSPKTSFLPA